MKAAITPAICAGLFGLAVQRPNILSQIVLPLVVFVGAFLAISMVYTIGFSNAQSAAFETIVDLDDWSKVENAAKAVVDIENKFYFNTFSIPAILFLIWVGICNWVADISRKDKSEKEHEAASDVSVTNDDETAL